jgi:hypothetical protein
VRKSQDGHLRCGGVSAEYAQTSGHPRCPAPSICPRRVGRACQRAIAVQCNISVAVTLGKCVGQAAMTLENGRECCNQPNCRNYGSQYRSRSHRIPRGTSGGDTVATTDHFPPSAQQPDGHRAHQLFHPPMHARQKTVPPPYLVVVCRVGSNPFEPAISAVIRGSFRAGRTRPRCCSGGDASTAAGSGLRGHPARPHCSQLTLGRTLRSPCPACFAGLVVVLGRVRRWTTAMWSMGLNLRC